MAVGEGHGLNGDAYYPPYRWGLDECEPNRFAPNWVRREYDSGYVSGKAKHKHVYNKITGHCDTCDKHESEPESQTHRENLAKYPLQPARKG